MDVPDRGARLEGPAVLLADLVRQERQVRLLLARDLGADAGDGDDELVAQGAPPLSLERHDAGAGGARHDLGGVEDRAADGARARRAR